MLNFWELLVLGLIQAILEWLPISSQGFLILTAVNIFGEDTTTALSTAVYFHLGTAIAVLIKYWRMYWNAVIKDRKLLRFIVITSLMTGIIGIPLYILLRNIFTEFTGLTITLLIGIALLITATLLRIGKLHARDSIPISECTIKDEILLGFCQGCAILPGISRSGTTVSYLLLRGYKREDVFHMSFLISLPAVIGAILFDFFFGSAAEGLIFRWEYLVVMVIVAVVGYIMMHLLLIISKRWSFDIICYILGGLSIMLAVPLLIFL